VRKVSDVPIPNSFFERVAERAEFEWIEDEKGWFATVPGYKGAWALGPTKDEARAELAEVLRDWVAVGVHFGDAMPDEVQSALAAARAG
jgi:predicted RNase H-like HicB family nuclease